jgi:hypothetical protein
MPIPGKLRIAVPVVWNLKSKKLASNNKQQTDNNNNNGTYQNYSEPNTIVGSQKNLKLEEEKFGPMPRQFCDTVRFGILRRSSSSSSHWKIHVLFLLNS